MIIPGVLVFYFLVCSSVLLFNFWNLISGRLVQWRTERWKQYYQRWMEKEQGRYNQSSLEEKDKMISEIAKELSHINRLMALYLAVEEMKDEDKKKCMPIIARIVQRILPYYKKSTDRGQAYYSFLLAHFEVMKYAPSEAITAFLMGQIRSKKSLYNLENALRAVYSSGDVELVLNAVELLDGSGTISIHEKLLVDGMLTFSRPDALILEFWKQFPHYSERMQKILLNYIRFASGKWGNRMLELLRTTSILENQIACVRYFARYPEERFRNVLYEIAEEDETEWELCAVCGSALASYAGEKTVRILKKMLCSPNWYVRYNAALSLRRLNVKQEELQDILEGSDRYAKEMLKYRFGINNQE